MSEQVSTTSEARLARAVFGPLGGVVEVGAVNSTGTWELADVSVGDFLAHRHQDVERLLAGIRAVCRFSDAAMAIVDELGRFRDHEVPAAFLVLWSAGITGVPQPLERLEEPAVVRRMCRMAADLQLTYFLQALITAAIAAGTEPRQEAAGVAEVLGIAADLADGTGGSAPLDIFRMWRVAHLPGILRPESDAPEGGKTGFRAYDEVLEELLRTTACSWPADSSVTEDLLMRTAEFLIDLDGEMLDYFREIAEEMVGRFGISRAEAVARINSTYEGARIGPYPDLMCHEMPEYWAYGLYFEPRDGRLPYGAPGEDLSAWEVRPAPSADSHVWTIRV